MAKSKVVYSKHPAVYVSKTGEPMLIMFTDFFKEMGLPKFQETVKKVEEKKNSNTLRTSIETDDPEKWKRQTYYRHVGEAIMHAAEEEDKKGRGVLKRLWDRITNNGTAEGVDATVTFDQVKGQMIRELPTTEELEDSRNKVNRLITYLRDTGQYGQADNLQELQKLVAYELTLMKAGYSKYITSKEVIDFLLKSEKGVSIDFLRSYPEILPIKVGKIKKEVDKLLIFDNYCVMYYDKKISKFTKKEIIEAELEKRRDPILFGMIEGSDRLYYITDWVIGEDDLTLETVENALNRRAYDLGEQTIALTNIRADALARTLEQIEAEDVGPMGEVSDTTAN